MKGEEMWADKRSKRSHAGQKGMNRSRKGHPFIVRRTLVYSLFFFFYLFTVTFALMATHGRARTAVIDGRNKDAEMRIPLRVFPPFFSFGWSDCVWLMLTIFYEWEGGRRKAVYWFGTRTNSCLTGFVDLYLSLRAPGCTCTCNI